MTGAEMIVAERKRQIEKEGYDARYDAKHIKGELKDAALAYIIASDDSAKDRAFAETLFPADWHKKFWKPSKDPIKNLVRAGALIAAEIDRLKAKE